HVVVEQQAEPHRHPGGWLVRVRGSSLYRRYAADAEGQAVMKLVIDRVEGRVERCDDGVRIPPGRDVRSGVSQQSPQERHDRRPYRLLPSRSPDVDVVRSYKSRNLAVLCDRSNGWPDRDVGLPPAVKR